MHTPITKAEYPRSHRQVYTMQEVADMLGVAYSSIWDQVQAQTFPVKPLRIGRVYRFPKERIDRLLTAGDTSSTP